MKTSRDLLILQPHVSENHKEIGRKSRENPKKIQRKSGDNAGNIANPYSTLGNFWTKIPYPGTEYCTSTRPSKLMDRIFLDLSLVDFPGLSHISPDFRIFSGLFCLWMVLSRKKLFTLFHYLFYVYAYKGKNAKKFIEFILLISWLHNKKLASCCFSSNIYVGMTFNQCYTAR